MYVLMTSRHLSERSYGPGMTRKQVLAVFLTLLMLGSSVVYGLSFV
jgi:hypothetical protein